MPAKSHNYLLASSGFGSKFSGVAFCLCQPIGGLLVLVRSQFSYRFFLIVSVVVKGHIPQHCLKHRSPVIIWHNFHKRKAVNAKFLAYIEQSVLHQTENKCVAITTVADCVNGTDGCGKTSLPMFYDIVQSMKVIILPVFRQNSLNERFIVGEEQNAITS